MRRDPPEPGSERTSGSPPPARQERLAEALRANLRRRKAQRRARKEADATADDGRREDGERQ